MTKLKPKSKSTFPADLYVVTEDGAEDPYFVSAAALTELLAPGDKAIVAVYRLVETCEMSADVVVTRKSAKK